MHNNSEFITIQYKQTPIGELLLGSYNNSLCLCDWRYRKQRNTIDERITKYLKAKYIEGETDTIRLANEQLDEYFSGTRKQFSIPLLPVGSLFQQKVWEALLQVPYGKMASYKSIAIAIENEKAVRAVAAANGANAISIFIPCHRIIGSNGQLTGYAAGIKNKEKLLRLENNLFS